MLGGKKIEKKRMWGWGEDSDFPTSQKKRITRKDKFKQLELIFVHYLMFYGQHFRREVDKHHLPKTTWLCQMKNLLERFLVCYALNQHLANFEMPRGSAAASRTRLASASGRLASWVIITVPGFNFLSLTKFDCLRQSSLSIWHILASAEHEEQ